MKHLFIVILFITAPFYGVSQDLKVLISEKKTGKRVVLMAENKTQDTLNVFLMVHAEGYRRSASKPVLKDLPPLSKTPMITLIELSGVPHQYTYELIVNEQKSELQFTVQKKANDIEKVIANKLVIFSKNDCSKCELLTALLKDKRIQHRNLNIEEDAVLYRQFMVFIEPKLQAETKIRFPVIWNKDHAIFGYDSITDILKELETASK
jgi:glutaredoxin